MDNLISRQAVKEWLERWEGYLDKDMIARMQLKVDDIPTHKIPSNVLDALDCVERQKAIDVCNIAIDLWTPQLGTGALIAVQDRISRLPSAQPRKGKWIYNSPVTMKCDQCGLVIKDWDWHRCKYCPNCMAEMRGEQE